ncbi:hypothetical protein Tco_0893580 [Tanacetum coccineum]|uniref:Uncharacterized protein n=1 Tax=Tanacetum coccineum TaxID=301880 RepID=A0ABQ5CC23_9ASTR
MLFITFQDVCLRQELLEYMCVHVNDASENSKPSWVKNVYIRGLVDFDVTMSTSRGSSVHYITKQGSYALRWKPCQGDSSKWNLPNHRSRRWCCSLTPAELDSLPHAHAQATKTYNKHQDSRVKKA